MDLKNMSEQLVKENYHARAQVETREKQIMARWQVSPLLVLFLSQSWQVSPLLVLFLSQS
jgi:hypothetical protein